MNQHGLYYTFIICCLLYVILIGQRFHAAKSRVQEPRIIITQLPSFSISKQYTDITISYNSDMHVNNIYSISSTNTKNNKVEIKQENNVKNLERISLLVDSVTKLSEQSSPHANLITRQELIPQQVQKISLQNSVQNIHQKRDKQLNYVRLLLFVLYNICSKVNAPSLKERVKARLNLVTKILPGLLGNWLDVVIARALPRYFTQSGSFYAYNYDPYILNDVITLLQYPSKLTGEQQKSLRQFRAVIVQHPFNQRLHAIISALEQNNTTLVKRIMQPHNRLISLLYQEFAARL